MSGYNALMSPVDEPARGPLQYSLGRLFVLVTLAAAFFALAAQAGYGLPIGCVIISLVFGAADEPGTGLSQHLSGRHPRRHVA